MNEKDSTNASKELESRIGRLQVLEQNLQAIRMQRQDIQSQIAEIDNALKSMETARGGIYKIVGSIMLSSTREELQKELGSKKEMLEVRLKGIKSQEEAFVEKFRTVQGALLEDLKKEGKQP